MGFCILENLVETPDYLWIVYFFPLAVTWPLIVCLGRAALTRTFSYLVSFSVIGYYVLLNIYFEPRFLWCVFPIFPLLWWPVSTTFGRDPFKRSVVGAGLIIVFFVVVNGITSPGYFWAIYPIFAVLWWPMSLYLAKKPLFFAVTGTGVIIVYFSLVNYFVSPHYLWAIYLAFAVSWWPLSVYYFVHRLRRLTH